MSKKLVIVIIVAAFAAVTVAAQTRHKPKTQRVRINLMESGYRPETFRLRRGIRARVTFVRRTDATCGQVIVIPKYGIRRDLPLNQPVTVTFTPRSSGTFKFTCGMDMLRGKIIVR